MISTFKVIEEVFVEINRVIGRKVEVYMIGGAVLLYQGLKNATKDIDLVFKNKQDFIEFQKALIKIGFGKEKVGELYKNLDLSYVLTRGDFRIDLFLSRVCSKFCLSEEMIKRAKRVVSLDKITLFNCSNSDIFLFKTMTERPGDLEDCMALARENINWQDIKEELMSQIKSSGKDIWITWVGERMDLLEDRGLNIPIRKDIDKLIVEYFESIE